MNLGTQSSASAASFGLAHLQMQIVQCAAGAYLAELDLLHRKLVYAQLTFGVYVPQKFAGRRIRRASAEQRRQETLQPAGPCARAHPTIKVRGVQMIGMKLEIPLCAAIRVDASLRELPGPTSAEPFHVRDAGAAQPVAPIQPRLVHLQR